MMFPFGRLMTSLVLHASLDPNKWIGNLDRYSSAPFMGAIEYHDVDATGSWIMVNHAINNALSEAIGRINGKSIARNHN